MHPTLATLDTNIRTQLAAIATEADLVEYKNSIFGKA